VLRFKLVAAKQGWLGHPFFLPRKFRSWLADQGSLTHRLKQRCRQFSVRPVRVGFIRPNRDECPALKLRPYRLAYVREVVLHCDGNAVVFAHSAVPGGSLRGPWAAVTTLGSRPLGEALFSNPRVMRGDLQYRRVQLRHPLARQARQAGIPTAGQTLWARRSLFTLHGHRLMVTEVFLPAVLTIGCEKK
jgi:chorismate--pyruvate lyase